MSVLKDVTGDELDQALAALRRRGVSYRNLAIVADVVYGWRLDSEQIRYRLRTHYGIAADPTRARYGEQNPLTYRREEAAA